MKMSLYTTIDQPQGRCLLLADKLHQVTRMNGTESIQASQRLFAGQHTRFNPAIVDVADIDRADDLIATCAEFGISAESVEGDNDPLLRQEVERSL